MDALPAAPAAPAVADTLEASVPNVTYGDFGVRAGAQVIDLAFGYALGIVGGVLGGITLAVLGAAGVVAPDAYERIGEDSALVTVASLLGAVVYRAVAEAVGGATLGKALCGLRVRSSKDHGAAGLGNTLVRGLAFYLDSLFFGMVAYATMKDDPLRKRLGDRWGHTVVVRAASLPAHLRVSGGLVALGVVAGMAVFSLLLALSVVAAAL